MPEQPQQSRVVGILGGTGEQGRGLAHRLALAGHRVLLGSRSAERARTTGAELASGHTGDEATGYAVEGMTNEEAAARAELVIAAMPYEGHRDVLAALVDELRGKIVVDCVNPLGFDKAGAHVLDIEAGSAAEEAAVALPGSRVVGAFHHVSAKKLLMPGALERTDVVVVGDDGDDKDEVIALVGSIDGMRGVDGGKLRMARSIEGLTAVLIAINRRYKCHAGVLITDLPAG